MTGIALFEMTAQYRQLAEQLSNLDLDATTVADTIEASGIVDDIAQKATGIEMIARTMEMHNPAIDAEIERLKALKLHRVKAALGLREYLRNNMQAAGILKLESPLFKIRLQNNPPSVDVFEPGLIPESLMTKPIAPPPQPNKEAIKAEINAGRDVPGAKLVQTQRLVVK